MRKLWGSQHACIAMHATFVMVYRIKFQSLDQSLLLFFSLLYRCLSTIYSPLITISHGLFFCCFMSFFSNCTLAMVEVGLCRSCQQTIPGTASELLQGEGQVKPQLVARTGSKGLKIQLLDYIQRLNQPLEDKFCLGLL